MSYVDAMRDAINLLLRNNLRLVNLLSVNLRFNQGWCNKLLLWNETLC